MKVVNSYMVKEKLMEEVEVTLTDGTVLQANFFRNPSERIIDLLNDDRAFLPLADKDGVVAFITKSAIWKIVPVDQDTEHPGEAPRSIGGV